MHGPDPLDDAVERRRRRLLALSGAPFLCGHGTTLTAAPPPASQLRADDEHVGLDQALAPVHRMGIIFLGLLGPIVVLTFFISTWVSREIADGEDMAVGQAGVDA